MRKFFENLQLNFYLPKLNVIQKFLNSVNQSQNSINSISSAECLPGLSKFSSKLEENSRALILQGELIWIVVTLEKSPNSQLEINLKDKKISNVLPTLKFSISLSKHDVNSNSEKAIPLNARFLESQVFIDEKEQAILQETENNTGEEAPLFYEIDYDENRIAYLLKIPVAIHQEHLDSYVNMKVSLFSPLEQVRNIGEPEDASFGGILNKIYETLSVNKDKKPYVLFKVQTMKITNIFDCQSSINCFGKKVFITLKVRNKLHEVLTEEDSSKQDGNGKLKLYIENVDFLLQNSVSKSQLDLLDREKISPEINEAFSYKILNAKMPLVLDETSEFSLIILVEKEKEFLKSDRKYLVYQCQECEKRGLQPPENSFFVYTEKIDEVERIPKTPTTNPFSNRTENLSFKEFPGTNKSPSLDNSSPATSRSNFDFSFFHSNLPLETKGSKTLLGHSEGSPSPYKFYSSNLKNVISDKKERLSPIRPQQLLEFHQSDNNECKCLKVEDSGCSIYMSTPMIIKWSINHLFFTSSIYRIVWNFKDVEIIGVTCRIASHYYKVGETIEIEVEVENKSLNDLKLDLLPPREVLQNLSSQNENLNHDLRIPQDGRDSTFNFKNMEKIMQEKIKNDQLLAIATEKSICFGTLRNKEKKRMKMSLLPLNHGTLKLDYIIFYEHQTNTYLKVHTPTTFVVT